jgi:hypothetical protein
MTATKLSSGQPTMGGIPAKPPVSWWQVTHSAERYSPKARSPLACAALAIVSPAMSAVTILLRARKRTPLKFGGILSELRSRGKLGTPRERCG